MMQRLQRGQGLVEYAVILACIAILVIVAITFLGHHVSSVLSSVGSSIISHAGPGGTPAPTEPPCHFPFCF